MKLDEAQRATVAGWIAAGSKLSEIQTRLASELGLKLTYMEVRFLVDDLKLVPKDPEPPKPVVPPPAAAPETIPGPQPGGAQTPAAPLTVGEAVPAAGARGNVVLTMDQVTRPGALVSGKVTFSDGAKADWYLDQRGRLGVVPVVQGYKPLPEDVEEFQIALQSELAKLGF